MFHTKDCKIVQLVSFGTSKQLSIVPVTTMLNAHCWEIQNHRSCHESPETLKWGRFETTLHFPFFGFLCSDRTVLSEYTQPKKHLGQLYVGTYITHPGTKFHIAKNWPSISSVLKGAENFGGYLDERRSTWKLSLSDLIHHEVITKEFLPRRRDKSTWLI